MYKVLIWKKRRNVRVACFRCFRSRDLCNGKRCFKFKFLSEMLRAEMGTCPGTLHLCQSMSFMVIHGLLLMLLPVAGLAHLVLTFHMFRSQLEHLFLLHHCWQCLVLSTCLSQISVCVHLELPICERWFTWFLASFIILCTCRIIIPTVC